MAVVYDHEEPRRSLAMVTNAKNDSWVVRVGGWLAGKPVIAMTPRALWLGPTNEPCWIRLQHEGNQRVKAKKRPKKRSKKHSKRKGKR